MAKMPLKEMKFVFARKYLGQNHFSWGFVVTTCVITKERMRTAVVERGSFLQLLSHLFFPHFLITWMSGHLCSSGNWLSWKLRFPPCEIASDHHFGSSHCSHQAIHSFIHWALSKHPLSDLHQTSSTTQGRYLCANQKRYPSCLPARSRTQRCLLRLS